MPSLQAVTRPRAADGEDGEEAFNWDDHPDEKSKLLDLNDQRGKVIQSLSTLENKYGDDSGQLHTNLRSKADEMNDDADSYESLGEEDDEVVQAMEDILGDLGFPDDHDFLTNY